MIAKDLMDALYSVKSLDIEKLQEIFSTLPEDASVHDFRSIIVEQKIMTFTQVMTIFMSKSLMPRSKSLLDKMESVRASRVDFEPERHVQKFHITDDDTYVTQIAFDAGNLAIKIPEPDLNSVKFEHSDEQQAAMLAIDMAKTGEMAEAEIILLETFESFDDSNASIQILAWLYLCTNHADRAEHWANLVLARSSDNTTLELLALAEQKQSKHLLAAAHYQKLLASQKIKSVWYLLAAYSLEKTQCPREAMENYHIYVQVGRNDDFRAVAQTHFKELRKS